MQGITTVELTEQAQALVDAIRAGNGEWVNRKFISTQTQRTISGADIALLDILVLNGVIEEQDEPTKAPSGIKKSYRVKE